MKTEAKAAGHTAGDLALVRSTRADARLMLAAPELLEACKALARLGIEECRNCVGTGQEDNHNDQACHVCGGVGEVVVGFPLPEEILAARSAIEKAEGRQ